MWRFRIQEKREMADSISGTLQLGEAALPRTNAEHKKEAFIMPTLDLSIDELLTTTRAVRQRLDLTRPVVPEVIQECLSLAVQAPTPGGMQNWHFVVVSDPSLRAALAMLYRKSAHAPGGQEDILKQVIAAAADEQEVSALSRKVAPARYLTEHLHEVPVHVIPCIEGRAENLSAVEQAAWWGGSGQRPGAS